MFNVAGKTSIAAFKTQLQLGLELRFERSYRLLFSYLKEPIVAF